MLTRSAPPPATDLELRNRERSRAASVVQMQQIARDPDYLRLGPSCTPDSCASTVFAVGDETLLTIPPDAFGWGGVAVMSDGQRVPFCYAVVAATRVQPSNFADGCANPAFASTETGTLKTLKMADR